MILKTETETFRIHFRYGQDERGRRWTMARWHRGDCEGKPCTKSDGGSGVARCSRRDCFIRAVGRKLALERALRNSGKETRRMLWTLYWAETPPPPKVRSLPRSGL